MISVSVKGDKIVDHYGLMNSEFHSMWTGDQMGSKNHDHGNLHSAIDEYDPNEEDYEDEEDDFDDIEDPDHLHPTQHNEGGQRLPTTPGISVDKGSREHWMNGNSGIDQSNKIPVNIGSTTDLLLPIPPTTSKTGGSSREEGLNLDGKNGNFLRFIKKLTNITRDAGLDIRLGCEAEGIPPPRNIKWFKNGVQDQLRGDRFRIKHSRKKTFEGKKSPIRIVGSTLKIRKLEVLDKGFYTCEVVGGDGQKISATGILNVIHDTGFESGVIPDFPSAFESFPEIGESGNVHRIDSFHRVPMLANTGALPHSNEVNSPLQPPIDGHGLCQPYRGTICKRFMENMTIYVHSEESQFLIENKLKEALTLIQHSPDISDRCSNYGIPSLCFYAFPQCPESFSSNPKFVIPHRLCRQECELLEQDLCRQEYDLAKRHPLIGQQLPLPECNQLPPLGSKASENCIPLGLPQPPLPLVDEEQPCYKDRGQDYRGTVKETFSGKSCKPWSQQPRFKSLEYPELIGGHSFCRNPGGLEPSPWCFTNSNTEHLSKESCKVEQCGIFGYADDKLWMSVAGGVAALFLLLVCMILCCCCRRGRTKSKKSSASLVSPGSIQLQQLEMNSLLKKIGQPNKTTEIPANRVQFYEELGQGAFGKVYKGDAVVRTGEPPVRVAIKTLKSSATAKTRQDFFREVELMGDLKHPNILCLLGVVTKEEPRSMLFEYMTHGDLHEFLMNHSPRADPSVTEFILEPNEMLFIATQIAAGMEYLAAHHYVHRDLAARNALVGESLTVKISDFGLSRDIYNSDYYRVHSKSLVPVRWMPPESITYGKFSTESDVWSFGIVLWEIYSFGLQPYYGYSNQEVIEIVRSRQLLPCPDLCPPRMYAIMVECWAELAHRRPSFEELHSRLKQWLLPLLGPNSNFSPHIHITSLTTTSNGYPFAPPSCASNNSMSSHQSSNTGPLSNNTNSTNVSTQWPQRNNQQTFFSNYSNANSNTNGHCVAYQSTPIIHCQVNNGGGGFSPQHHHPTATATAHFHTGTGRVSHSHSPQSIIGSGNSVHSPSPYRVLMESKATNI